MQKEIFGAEDLLKLYQQVIRGEFIDRPNRFIARVRLGNTVEVCHVKNTGRCRELLLPGAAVTLAVSSRKERKTRCDLVAVRKGNLLINLDSQAPNQAAREALSRLFPGLSGIRPETVFGRSRLDFSAEWEGKTLFVEVKGVTLEDGGTALFPDAPTERGTRHLHELEACVAAGCRAALLLVIQMKGVTQFRPNARTDPAFAHALRHARDAGVQILAYDCRVTEDSMTLDQPVPVAWDECF